MSTEDIWAVAASFGEIFAVESPPTHSDMDVAFRRARVLSPQSAPGSGIFSISKARRITNAFDQADEGKVDGLIRALVSSLVAKRVFEKTHDEVTQNLLAELRRNLARVERELSGSSQMRV